MKKFILTLILFGGLLTGPSIAQENRERNFDVEDYEEEINSGVTMAKVLLSRTDRYQIIMLEEAAFPDDYKLTSCFGQPGTAEDKMKENAKNHEFFMKFGKVESKTIDEWNDEEIRAYVTDNISPNHFLLILNKGSEILLEKRELLYSKNE